MILTALELDFRQCVPRWEGPLPAQRTIDAATIIQCSVKHLMTTALAMEIAGYSDEERKNESLQNEVLLLRKHMLPHFIGKNSSSMSVVSGITTPSCWTRNEEEKDRKVPRTISLTSTDVTSSSGVGGVSPTEAGTGTRAETKADQTDPTVPKKIPTTYIDDMSCNCYWCKGSVGNTSVPMVLPAAMATLPRASAVRNEPPRTRSPTRKARARVTAFPKGRRRSARLSKAPGTATMGK